MRLEHLFFPRGRDGAGRGDVRVAGGCRGDDAPDRAGTLNTPPTAARSEGRRVAGASHGAARERSERAPDEAPGAERHVREVRGPERSAATSLAARAGGGPEWIMLARVGAFPGSPGRFEPLAEPRDASPSGPFTASVA